MSTVTPVYGWPYPVESDPPDVPTYMGNLALAQEATVSANAAAAAAAATRTALLTTLVGTGGTRYTDFLATQTVANLTVTGYTNVVDTSAVICGHTFVAPPSGIVEITWGNNILSGSSSSTVFVGTAVNVGGVVGSGAVQSAASDNEAFTTSNTARVPGTRSRVLTGLSPGTTYNVRQQWRNSGSTTSTSITPWIVTKSVLS